MPNVISSITAEYGRYKALGEAAMAQVSDTEISHARNEGDNSIAALVWHVAGNLKSRFTDFRTTDGEKPWRERDEEFAERTVPREQLLAVWEDGWRALFSALEALNDADLDATVTIRRQPFTIHEALHRSLAHTSYHVGQIVYVAKSIRGAAWQTLSIPKGGSAAANRNPELQAAERHADALSRRAKP